MSTFSGDVDLMTLAAAVLLVAAITTYLNAAPTNRRSPRVIPLTLLIVAVLVNVVFTNFQ